MVLEKEPAQNRGGMCLKGEGGREEKK